MPRTTMEMIMSTTFGTLAGVRSRTPASGLMATLTAWWMGYLMRRIERAAIMQLHAMSDRELQDIGLARTEIEWAVRGEFDPRPFTRHC